MTLNWTALMHRVLSLLLGLLVVLMVSAAVFGRILPLTGRTTLVVQGQSMEPAIQLGAAIVAAPVDPAELHVNDIVSMRVGAGRAVVTHRIIRIVEHDGAIWIETKGDANPSADPSIIPATDVIGRVDLVVPDLGYLLALLSTGSGIALAIGLAGALLAARAFVGTFAPSTENRGPLGTEAIANL